MYVYLIKRQLNALEAEAYERGKSDERREQINRSCSQVFERTYANVPVLTRWGHIMVGDIILGCQGGDSFYHEARVTGVYGNGEAVVPSGVAASQPLRLGERERWVTWEAIEPRGGSGGQRVRIETRVLAEGEALSPGGV